MQGDDTNTVSTLITEARQHITDAESVEMEGEASAFIAVELAQAKAMVALATILEMWSYEGIPTFVLK